MSSCARRPATSTRRPWPSSTMVAPGSAGPATSRLTACRSSWKSRSRGEGRHRHHRPAAPAGALQEHGSAAPALPAGQHQPDPHLAAPVHRGRSGAPHRPPVLQAADREQPEQAQSSPGAAPLSRHGTGAAQHLHPPRLQHPGLHQQAEGRPQAGLHRTCPAGAQPVAAAESLCRAG